MEEKTKEFNIEELLTSDQEKQFTFNGQNYSIVETTIDDEIKNVELYTDEKGRVIPQLAKVFELTKMVQVPYTSSHILKVLKIEKEWKDLSYKQRMNFLKSFKTEYLSQLISASRQSQNKDVEEEALKN